MVVAELFLAALIQVLFQKLAYRKLLNIARREGIRTHLKKLRKMLLQIHAVLSDAEERHITDEAVKMWLDDLTDLAYDLDDVLDQFFTQALRLKLRAEPQPSTTTKVRNLIPNCCTRLTPSAIRFDHDLRSKIDDITARFHEIATLKNELGLKENGGGGIRANRIRERLPTTSLVDRSCVYGREKERDDLLNLLLLSGETSSYGGTIHVIPIVGMAGVGKTTVAQLVYDDNNLRGDFDLRAWVCVSDDFDVFRVTKAMLESFTSESFDLDLDTLQRKLKENLAGKKFLLVLDDVWNENYDEWDVLRRPFLDGAPGSKIIVTTRNRSVASIMSSSLPYHLKELSQDDCLSLFAHHALGRRNFDSHPNLKEIGEEIVNKCNGLPLAAKTLGGLLRSKLHQNEWADILNSNIWDLPEQRSGILPALRLSYHHLPSHLKRCFAYCSIFPKGYEFDKEELVLLWMGEGLLQVSEGKKWVEDFGSECFDDLLSMSLFQGSSGNGSQFVMHDLINDLAQYVAGDLCFRLEGRELYRISERARHFSYIRQEYEVFQKFMPLDKAKHLRTFLPLPVNKLNSWHDFYLTNKVLLDLLPKLQYIRVLSLSGYSISELPNLIGDLQHLRYLNLSKTPIKSLPESVSCLYNLETLSLRGCRALSKLPSGIGNLINLRHLDVANTRRLQEMPLGICKLTGLRTLSKVVVGKNSGLGLGIKALRDLLLLRGTILIAGLQNVKDIWDAKEANLKHKQELDDLGMEWSCDFDDSRNENLEMNVLDMLQPHRNLKRLNIEYYGGMKFPNWLGDPSFSIMVNLNLSGCVKCTSLPPLGQLPMLKELCIVGMYGIKSVGAEFYRDGCPLEFPFPSLETLMFKDMPEWEEWSSFAGVGEAAGQFPCLHELTISECPKLIRVSLLRLPSLHKLDIQECSEVLLKSVADLTSLTTLRLQGVTELTSLHNEFMQFSNSLEVVEFHQCPQLVTLWQNGVTLENLDRVHVLIVSGCQQLLSLREEEQALPHNLKVLVIDNCANLEKLPKGLNSLTSLRINKLPKLVSFPETSLPLMLRRLEIRRCGALESLPDGISCLEDLKINECSSLRSLPTGKLPTTLKSLQINDCKLESVSDTMLRNCSTSLEHFVIYKWPNFRRFLECGYSFSNLVKLEIDSCRGLESFPEECLPTPNLKSLTIKYCARVRSLSYQIQGLTSLKHLEICNCPSLESFPEGDFPPNITSLCVIDCEKLKPLSQWGLHRLMSIQRLTIVSGYPELTSFHYEKGECLLPATLTFLCVAQLPNLESLSKGLQNLTSLEHLSIMYCPKLWSLPKEDLLSKLSYLEIWGCPLLKQRCLKDKGVYWHKIDHIPCLKIGED